MTAAFVGKGYLRDCIPACHSNLSRSSGCCEPDIYWHLNSDGWPSMPHSNCDCSVEAIWVKVFEAEVPAR